MLILRARASKSIGENNRLIDSYVKVIRMEEEDRFINDLEKKRKSKKKKRGPYRKSSLSGRQVIIE